MSQHLDLMCNKYSYWIITVITCFIKPLLCHSQWYSGIKFTYHLLRNSKIFTASNPPNTSINELDTKFHHICDLIQRENTQQWSVYWSREKTSSSDQVLIQRENHLIENIHQNLPDSSHLLHHTSTVNTSCSLHYPVPNLHTHISNCSKPSHTHF